MEHTGNLTIAHIQCQPELTREEDGSVCHADSHVVKEPGRGKPAVVMFDVEGDRLPD